MGWGGWAVGIRLAMRVGALLLSIGLVHHGAKAAGLRAGDLLVSDRTGNRILRVDPTSGFVDVFSPVPGETNLLSSPRQIVHDPDRRAVLVASEVSNALVAIDAETGLQSEVTTFSFSPFGVALASEDRRRPAGREIYVSGARGIWEENRIVRVDGPLDGATVTPELTEPGYTFGSLAVVEDAAGPHTLFGYLMACDEPPLSVCRYGIGRYVLGESVPSYLLPDTGPLGDVEVLPLSVPGSYTLLFAACSGSLKGVYQLLFGIFPIATEGLVDCPDALAVRGLPSGLEAFVAQGCHGDACPPGVVARVVQEDADFVASLVAELPSSTRVSDLELVPEPVPLASVASAALALAALARRRPPRCSGAPRARNGADGKGRAR